MSNDAKVLLVSALLVSAIIMAATAGVTITSLDSTAHETVLRKACIEAGGTVIDVTPRGSHHCLRLESKAPAK